MPPKANSSEKLLREIVEYLGTLAESEKDPTLKEGIRKRVAEYKKVTQGMSESADSADATGSRRDGPWIRLPRWLEKEGDPPFLFECGEEHIRSWRDYSVESLCDHPLTEALGIAFPDCDPHRQETVRIRFAEPDFLPGVTIAHVTRGSAPVWEAVFSITQTNNGTYTARSFDFESPEVHRLNASTPLNCVGHELEYLRFFMYVVRGELGAFRLLEGMVLAEARPYLESAEIWKELLPLRFRRVAADGRIVFRANVLYGRHVFTTELAVAPDGNVEMLNDSPVADNLIEELAE